MENTKPVVTLCHVLVNIIDGGTQFFAEPNDPTQIPEDAIWVSLGNTENNWIEVHPVEEHESATLQAFLEPGSGYEVTLDDEYVLPSWIGVDWVTADIANDCRWFAERYE